MQSIITRIIATLISLACVMQYAIAQSPEDLALSGAQQMIEAMTSSDAKTVAKWMPPVLKQAMGGEASLVQFLESQYQDARTMGMEYETKFLGAPTTPRMVGNILFLFIPYMVTAHSHTTRITHIAYYLGLSYDSGKEWYFVDGIQLTPESIKYLLPGYSGQPPLPEVERKAGPRFRIP